MANRAQRRQGVGHCLQYMSESWKTTEERLPLNPSHAQELFKRWGLDFVEPLKVSKTRRCRDIVLATEYLTKCVEARALSNNSAISTAKFIFEQIIIRYGIPLQLTSNCGGTLSIMSSDYSLQSSKLIIHCQARTTQEPTDRQKLQTRSWSG